MQKVAVVDLQRFLTRNSLEVRDVRAGVVAGTRRLLLGSSSSGEPTRVVSMAGVADAVPAVEREARNLAALADQLPESVRETVGQVLDEVSADGRTAVVLTAVRGLSVKRGGGADDRRAAEAVLAWLRDLWSATAGAPAPVDLGKRALEELRARYAAVGGTPEMLETVQRSHGRLAEYSIPRVMTHGCLCARHAYTEGGVVVGVDDWTGSASSDPLLDLGSWVVRTRATELAEVLAGGARTATGRAQRDFVASGLEVWGIPAALWKDVLVLSRAELAVAALRDGDFGAMSALEQVTRKIPRQRMPRRRVT